MGFDGLKNLVLPVDNIGGKTARQQLKAIMNCLHNEEAVIIFPAGEVSRISPSGVKDQKMESELSEKLPIKPIARYYLFILVGVILCCSTPVRLFTAHFLLCSLRMRCSANVIVRFLCKWVSLFRLKKLPLYLWVIKRKSKLVKRHLYRIAKDKKPLLKTEKTINHPQNRQLNKARAKNRWAPWEYQGQ